MLRTCLEQLLGCCYDARELVDGWAEFFLQVTDTDGGVNRGLLGGGDGQTGIQEGGVRYPCVSHCSTGLLMSHPPIRLCAIADE